MEKTKVGSSDNKNLKNTLKRLKQMNKMYEKRVQNKQKLITMMKQGLRVDDPELQKQLAALSEETQVWQALTEEEEQELAEEEARQSAGVSEEETESARIKRLSEKRSLISKFSYSRFNSRRGSLGDGASFNCRRRSWKTT